MSDRLAAADVPRLRRECAEWTARRGAEMNELMIGYGRGTLVPTVLGPALAAEALAAEEAARLGAAELFYAGPDVVELVNAAAPSMPEFAPRAWDLPAPCGLIVFGAPLATRGPTPEEELFAELHGAPQTVLQDIQTTEVIAAGWGPWDPTVPHWATSLTQQGKQAHLRQPHGGGWVWMSFYTLPGEAAKAQILEAIAAARTAAARAQATAALDFHGRGLTNENEFAFALCPDEFAEGTTEDDYKLPDAEGTLSVWARAVLATFQLMRQPKITTTADEPIARPERRAHVRARIPEPSAVHTVTLRGRPAEPHAPAADGTGRTLSVRFPVGPFWRNQWYPSQQTHRPKLIPQYMKGPADAPVVGAERVRIITDPAGGTR